MDNAVDPNTADTGDFLLTNRLTTPEIYADGFSQLLMGFPVSKILFHSVTDPKTDEQKEVRKTVATVVVPTITLIQLAQAIISGCKNAEGQFVEMSEGATKQLKAILAQFPPGKLPGNVRVDLPKT